MIVGGQAPSYEGKAVMADGEIKVVKPSDFIGKKYVILFFYPSDWTFVCPTEVLAFSQKTAEFAKMDVQVLGCSVDSVHCHAAWRKAAISEGGIGKINFPLVEDVKKEIATGYDVLMDTGAALRGLFVIDKKNVIQHCVINNLSIGRDVDEALRVITALRFTEEHGNVCPANWKAGKKAIMPNVKDTSSYLAEAYAK